MIELIVKILISMMIATGLGVVVFHRTRHLRRSATGYERGLNMVPLRIHLPPISDDVATGNRDSRDIVDENISKAQVLYNIIASTAQKDDFKTKYYGQLHVGLELIASSGFVYFYVTAPSSLIAVVRQAITSAYPTAQVEEYDEHNFFDDKGSLKGVHSGEMVLKNEFAYPIATYMDSKKDVMQSILNAFGSLDETDSAGMQILIRPAKSGWTKEAQTVISAKKKGDKKQSIGKAVLGFTKEVVTAPVKSPDDDADKGKDAPKEISGTDQLLIESIESKIKHPGFEVLIRLLVSSDVDEKSKAIHNNIAASFALFEAPGQNGFKQTEIKDIKEAITAFNLRLFPVERDKDILNTIELASLFHIPDQSHIPTTQLERQSSKQVDGPRSMSDEGLLLGENVFRGNRKKITLNDEDRMRHMYIVGQTGTGKSVFLENMALQDMASGKGFAFVDPHGETAETLMAKVPKNRMQDVIYCNPTNLEFPMGLNIFEHDDVDQQDFLIQEAMNMLYKLYDPNNQSIIGPRYEYMFRNAAKAIMADPRGGTFIDIPKLFNDRNFVNEKLKHVTDRSVIDFWQKELPSTERSEESGNIKSWFVSKFSAFLGNTMMRNMIGQTKSSFNIREIMDQGKILIVNLSKGKTGELNMKLLGMLFVTKFQMAAMSRADVDVSQRRDFTLYVDEFQNFATESFASILSEARKYRLSLIVANQFTTQLTEEIRDAVFGNVGTAVSFRVGAADAENMVKQFYSPVFEVDDLTRLPLGQAYVRMLVDGVPTQPFSMSTFPELQEKDHELRREVERMSFTRYGRPRKEVEKEIFSRLETPTAAPTPHHSSGSSPNMVLPPQPPNTRPTSTPRSTTNPPLSAVPKPSNSFLASWLDKKSKLPHSPSSQIRDNPAKVSAKTGQVTPKRPQKVTSPQPDKHKPRVQNPKNNVTPGSLRDDGDHSSDFQNIPHIDN